MQAAQAAWGKILKWMQATWLNPLMVIVVLILIALIVGGYVGPKWTWVSPPSTLWAWLTDLSVPGTIGGVIAGFLTTQKSAQQDSMVAGFKQNVGNLILTVAPAKNADQIKIAQQQANALTHSVVPKLDALHKAEAVAFLNWGNHIDYTEKTSKTAFKDALRKPLKAQLHFSALADIPQSATVAGNITKFITSDELKDLLE